MSDLSGKVRAALAHMYYAHFAHLALGLPLASAVDFLVPVSGQARPLIVTRNGCVVLVTTE